MRQLFAFTFFYFVCLSGYGQSIVIANPAKNIIYVNVSNQLDVLIEGHKCKDVTVSTDNGKIEATNDVCRYSISPAKIGIAILTVTSKATKKKLGTYTFRVHAIPEPVALVANKNGGDIKKLEFKIQVGIAAATFDFEYDIRVVVDGFTVSIRRDGQTIFTKTCKGSSFPPEVIEAFQTLEANDFVLFSEMKYKSAYKTGMLQPVEFKIID